MNLDVNFVNNRRMRAGDYRVAARCFEDVIERYREHAFAHYFLAKAYERMGGHDAKVRENMRTYEAIVARNDTWRAHADYFGLTGLPRVESPATVPLAMTAPALAAAAP
jgi:uncharacterized protein (DUF927 family)